MSVFREVNNTSQLNLTRPDTLLVQGYNNPLRQESNLGGMVTSIYPDICSRYGTTLIDNYYTYFPSVMCDIGFVTSTAGGPTSTESASMPLKAQYVGTITPSGWRYQVYDKPTGTSIWLPDNIIGTGRFQCLWNGDVIPTIVGKGGPWTVTISPKSYYVTVPF